MPARVIVTGVILIIMVVMMAFVVEFFLPLSIKSEMNSICRNTLLEMEVKGGLLEKEKTELQEKLQDKGLINITVTGTSSAKQGEPLNLHVEADYQANVFIDLFIRMKQIQHMSYDKTTMSRKVIN